MTIVEVVVEVSGHAIVTDGSALHGLVGAVAVDHVWVWLIRTSLAELPLEVSLGMQYRTRSAPLTLDPVGLPTVWKTRSYGAARSTSFGLEMGLEMFRSC